jgi:transcriptional regulator with XRE-family HTH domain
MSKGIFTPKQKKLVELLRQTRKEAGLAQWQLAERLKRTQSQISKIERGEHRLDLLELYEFCEAVGVSMQEFIRRFEDSLDEG